MNDNSYIMYHCHTEDSLLDSCTKAQDYIDLAVENGQKALSISEHGKPLNWTEKWAACNKAGIKYMHSVEIYLTESLEEKVRDNYHTVLIARNNEGLKEINRLVDMSSNEEHFYYVNRISFEEFLNISPNIITTSACLASPLNKLPNDHPMYEKLVRKYNFLEVQPHNHPDQIAFNKKLYMLSKIFNKPLIAGTDTHSSSKYKAECRQVLLEAKRKSYGDEDAFDLSYKTYDELVEMFKIQNALPESVFMRAIENTNMLYDMTEEITVDTEIKYPILYGSREKDSEVFVETINRKFEEKVSSHIIPEEQVENFKTAMQEELRVFQKLHMDGFMLSMSELISWCKEQGMAIGTARGSVGGSRIAYVTDIIDLNPETWHTVFSRFCNEDREEIGDIDIDCVEEDRPKIFEYIRSRFGDSKTARVASFGTIKDRGLIDDVGRALAIRWEVANRGLDRAEIKGKIAFSADNPWSLKDIARIKDEFDEDPEATKRKYPELFYYYDGLVGTKISQSVHPAGMIISPVTLNDNYGTFMKDGEKCMLLDMENLHEYSGLAKYDFLILKTVQVIRDACNYIGVPYPKTNEIDWEDQKVWSDMAKDATGIFQFEGKFAHDSLKKFQPKNIFDMSLITACIRPTGASYRDELLARKVHHNPSELIDNLLKNNLGYLVYQEDTIAFLQQICGLSGSAADNIRRAIGRKQRDRLDAAMPDILEGYCSKSDKPREVAEQEAKEFLQVIEDSASYQFGYNHSIAYCLLGYLCAYYRYYYPLEFLTSFLNNAANQDDINNGTKYASKIGVRVTTPKWGVSKSDYYYSNSDRVITKGMSSIKYMSESVAEELYQLAHRRDYKNFVDVLMAIDGDSSIDSRQTEILIKLDFFSDFGNQRELLTIYDMYDRFFKRGKAKQIKRDQIDGTPFEPIMRKNSTWTTKSGDEAKSYTIVSMESLLRDMEKYVKDGQMDDIDDRVKIKNFEEYMGYIGYSSGKESDRRKLYILDIYPLKRKKDGKQFGYSVITKSIGSGKESRFTVFNYIFNKEPLQKGDIITLTGWERDGIYFRMTSYIKEM